MKSVQRANAGVHLKIECVQKTKDRERRKVHEREGRFTYVYTGAVCI